MRISGVVAAEKEIESAEGMPIKINEAPKGDPTFDHDRQRVAS